jgi:hypothetical protein
VNIKLFFVDALTAALDTNIANPDDVLRHITPDILSVHLPRPLWARLITACLGAPRVSATLVVETVGIPNLCEHIPANIIWGFVADVAQRALGIGRHAEGTSPGTHITKTGRAMIAPPPDVSANAPTSPASPVAAEQPLADIITELETEEPRPAHQLRSPGSRSPTSQRFRQSSTGVNRPGIGPNPNLVRRPQAPAAPATLPRPSASVSIPARRSSTELAAEPDPGTAVETADWGSRELVVDDSQLVDWQTDVGAASAITGDDDFSDLGNRKR